MAIHSVKDEVMVGIWRIDEWPIRLHATSNAYSNAVD